MNQISNEEACCLTIEEPSAAKERLSNCKLSVQARRLLSLYMHMRVFVSINE